jgi:hypothetical protein
MTLASHGNADFPFHSADPGVTDSYISREAADSPATFYEEVLVQAGTFIKTDDPTAAAHPAVNKDEAQVEKEVKDNETKPN